MKYIWLKNEFENSYAEFMTTFYCEGNKTSLKITADFEYAAYINGEFAANGQYADIPEYKAFSVHDISAFVKKGENTLVVKACHMGTGHFVCRPMTACVAFEVRNDGKIVAASDENTLARREVHYSEGDSLTPQIGTWYNYSFTAKEEPWEKCRVVTPDFNEVMKPIKNTFISKERLCSVTAQGVFSLFRGQTSAEKLQNAWLSSIHFNEMTGEDKTLHNGFSHPLTFSAKGGDGIYVVFDLGRECAGYPLFSLDCDSDTEAYLGWGEHLTDLRPRTRRGDRNFAFRIELKKGRNDFSDYLRRIGCRYFILFVCAEKVKINSFGLREELYPFSKPEKDFGDRLLNMIYETGRRTLELCAHEHYEDCPWREQALYGMDSRNQMLFGYGAFGEYEYARANLRLFAKCIEYDGLMPICPPSQAGLTIPSFSVYWVIAVNENAAADYDEEFIIDVIPAIEKVIETFKLNTEDGMIKLFEGERYWNFHEWSEGLTGGRFDCGSGEIPVGYDGILTALVYKAAKNTALLEEKLGRTEKAEKLKVYASELFDGMKKFYDEKSGFFASYRYGGEKIGRHEFTQAVFVNCSEGAFGEKINADICAALKNPKDLVKITLAGLPLKYEALIKYGGEKDWVINNVAEIFGGMLLRGATSFWETEKGEEDFDGAGSLCHGWSAVACYVLDLLKNKK